MLRELVGTALLVLVPLADELPAQAGPREDVHGVVVDRDGKPWSGAAVTLCHAPHPAITDEALCDRVVVPTDADGKFTARLLVAARYVAWAASPRPNVDRSYRCTHVAERVVAGAPVKLTEGELHWQRRVRPEVDDSWKGGLQFTVSSRVGPFLLQQPVPVRDGLLTLPPTPGTMVELLAHDFMMPVFATRLALVDGERRREEGLRTTLDVERTIAIGPARWRAARAVDNKGEAVLDARLVSMELGPSELLGLAGCDGVLRVAPDALHDVMVLLQSDAGIEVAVDVRDFTSDAAPKPIPVGEPGLAKGRLLLRAGQPAANVLLLVDKVAMTSGASQWAAPPRPVRTGVDGSFAIAGAFPAFALWCTAVLTPEQRAPWNTPGTTPLSPLALVQTLTVANDLQIRLDELQAVDVNVLDARGKAAGPVQLIVLPMPGAGLPEHSYALSTMDVQADARGRARFLAPKGVELAVWAFGEASAGWLRTRVDGRRNELQLDARHVLPIRVVDPEGKPVAGARVHLTITEDPEAPAAVRAMVPALGMLRHGRSFGEDRVTGADGHVDLLVPLIGCSLELQGGAGRQRGYADFGWFRGSPKDRFDLALEQR